MSRLNQQSSILTEQELQLLSSPENKTQQTTFNVYSFQYKVELAQCQIKLSHSIEHLMVMLSASPRGSAVILPDSIESNSSLDKLILLLTKRADIRVFWLGQLPSMETNLPVFVHCRDKQRLQHDITAWQTYLVHTFAAWLTQYSVACISENEERKKQHQVDFYALGLTNVDYFNGHSALTELGQQKLLIIDLEVVDLHLLNILNQLTSRDHFPIVIIYGRLPTNLCRATYTLIENNGFPIFASINMIPDKAHWDKLFSSLFSKVYLKHWINDDNTKSGAYQLSHLATQTVNGYFCEYGMTQEQIAALPKPPNMHHIINARSLKDWFPDGIKREIRSQLADTLNCEQYNLHICIEYPERIQRTSIFFSSLVMARLAKTKVYWLLENENNLLSDILKSFPISEVILSEALSHQLLTDPSDMLLDFIEQAQLQEVNIIASIQPSNSTHEALALYGIESVLNKQSYIE